MSIIELTENINIINYIREHNKRLDVMYYENPEQFMIYNLLE